MSFKPTKYDKNLTGKTKETYESVERMLMNLFGSDREKRFLDSEDVIDIIDNTSYARSTKKILYVVINIILQKMPDFKDNDKARDAYNNYLEQIQKINNSISYDLADNKLSKKEKEKFISFKEVNKLREVLEQDAYDKKNNYLDYMIVCLYSLFPPRRVSDFALMKLTNKDSDLDEHYNYLYIRGNKMKFIFNNYKTRKNYGIQKFVVPSDLTKIIEHWVDTYINKNDGFLISKDGGMSGYTEKDLSKFIIRIFKKHLGVNSGVSVLRHSFISEFSDERHSLKEREELAEKMGHSIYLQLQYDRIDEEPEEI